MSQPFVGEIKTLGFGFAPRGYATCSGQLIAISQNAALFSLLGTTYGGNGTSTFQLPNLNGRHAIGQGQSPGTSVYVLGESAGVENASILISNLPQHIHPLTGTVGVTTTVNTVSTPANQPKPGGNLLAKSLDAVSSNVVTTYSNSATDSALGGVSSSVSNTLAVGITGSGIPLTILTPFLTINYSIATVGIYPSRS